MQRYPLFLVWLLAYYQLVLGQAVFVYDNKLFLHGRFLLFRDLALLTLVTNF